jgi:hypothetical protein
MICKGLIAASDPDKNKHTTISANVTHLILSTKIELKKKSMSFFTG